MRTIQGPRPARFDWTRRAVCTLALALATACERGPSGAATVHAVSGAVLAVNGTPVTVEEIDEVASWYAMLEPQFTLPHLRRLALTNVVLPKAAARTAEPARRAAAEADARAALAGCRAGSLPAEPELRASEGAWREIGLALWKAGTDAEIGQWTDVIESPGCFHLIRVKERRFGRTPRETVFVLDALDFPYLALEEGHAALDRAIDRAKLTFIDESWRDVVPILWQHRMRGESK